MRATAKDRADAGRPAATQHQTAPGNPGTKHLAISSRKRGHIGNVTLPKFDDQLNPWIKVL